MATTVDATATSAPPYPRPYPIASADCHVMHSPEVFGGLPEHLRDHAPTNVEKNGIQWYVTENGPPYPGLPHDLPDVWDDPKTYAIMREREYRGTAARLEGRVLPEATPAGRLADQARDGVEVEVLYPNISHVYASHDAEYQAAVSRRYNDWLADWVRGYEHRLVANAIVPLCLDRIDDTISELTRARQLGFRSATLPISVPWLPYDRPEYEPLWSAFEDLEMIAAFHVASGNTLIVSDFVNLRTVPQPFLDDFRRRVDEFAWVETPAMAVMVMASGMSPIVHLTTSGALERHPAFRFVVVESEMGWLGWVLQEMDTMGHKRRAHFRDYKLDLLPSEYFKRQGWITFTDDPVGLAHLEFVGSDRVLWSNDYPHDEGTFLESQELIRDSFRHLDAETQRRLLWANAAELYGLDEAQILRDRESTN
jgi:predicted TIM-barrel fold metal-dependent hydrolase